MREVAPGWPGVQPVTVELGDAGGSVPALAYVDVVGVPQVGDRVLLNTTALERGLGTGGYAVVTAIPDRPAAWPGGGVGASSGAIDPEAPGHLVKARYTPLQTMVLGVDDPEGEHHAVLADADDLDGMPVVAADLHSSLPAVLAGVRLAAERGEAERGGNEPGGAEQTLADAGAHAPVSSVPRVAYVMTDGGALPLAFSRSVATLRDAGWLAATITCGQAYGGDLEAVTVHTALLAARHVVGAELAIVIQGPGNLGTGTRWGFSGVATGEALNAAAVLGGRPVAALRVSQADERPRHRGLSHHSATAYGRVLAHGADLVVPVATEDAAQPLEDCLALVQRQASELATAAPHLRLVEVATDGVLDALRHSPVRLSTMGRGLDEDPAAFVAAAAAGIHAWGLARGVSPGSDVPSGVQRL